MKSKKKKERYSRFKENRERIVENTLKQYAEQKKKQIERMKILKEETSYSEQLKVKMKN